MGERKRSSREFKQDAVHLARQPDQSVQGVARDLGIRDSSLHRWARELNAQGRSAFPGHGRQVLTSAQAEIKRLQRELDIARQERDLLRGAVAFFAKDDKEPCSSSSKHTGVRSDWICGVGRWVSPGAGTLRGGEGRPVQEQPKRSG